MSENEPILGEALSLQPETLLKIENKDVLDRLLALGGAAQNIEIINIKSPVDVIGLPQEIPLALHRGAAPKLEGLRALFDAYRTAPERRRGVAQVDNLQSFIDLVNRHKDEHSVIFANTDLKEAKLLAVIDYHETSGVARFGNHRVEYNFPTTKEFQVWQHFNGEKFDQGEFASFLEDHIAELASPMDQERNEFETLFKTKFGAPNEIIDLSRGLQVNVGAKVKNSVTLQSGESEVVFTEEHTNAQGEKLIVPGLFMISLPAFESGEPVRIPVRLRYRAATAIKWFYQLYRPDFWLREQIKNDLLTAALATSLPAYEGAPEA
ncbi:DUF2303 family protein [Methylosinus sp. Sm6]|uniref:DUF2303 family protein n=1 Tax=Methylosinus sp. Sm6 TaxID=2866948 RepID=UPI001C99082A|nr:DUF2303 family protein [Methylosinus sp. Sm6]MBY6239848.1 YfdQ family protein [Methylosinus sp. Sm6]